MDDNELEPREPTSDETPPEEAIKPAVEGSVESESTEQKSEFEESAEMIAIRERVEKGERLTIELYTAYQVAGENVVKTFSGDEQGIKNLEMQLKCYELQAIGGMGTDAIEQIYELVEGMPGTDFYAGIYKKAIETAERIAEEIVDKEEQKTPPSSSDTEPVKVTKEAPPTRLLDAFIESPVEKEIRSRLAERKEKGDLTIGEFSAEYYIPLLEHAESLANQVGPKDREAAQIQLIGHMANFAAEAGFREVVKEQLRKQVTDLREAKKDTFADELELTLLRIDQPSEENSKRFVEILRRYVSEGS